MSASLPVSRGITSLLTQHHNRINYLMQFFSCPYLLGHHPKLTQKIQVSVLVSPLHVHLKGTLTLPRPTNPERKLDQHFYDPTFLDHTYAL